MSGLLLLLPFPVPRLLHANVKQIKSAPQTFGDKRITRGFGLLALLRLQPGLGSPHSVLGHAGIGIFPSWECSSAPELQGSELSALPLSAPRALLQELGRIDPKSSASAGYQAAPGEVSPRALLWVFLRANRDPTTPALSTAYQFYSFAAQKLQQQVQRLPFKAASTELGR